MMMTGGTSAVLNYAGNKSQNTHVVDLTKNADIAGNITGVKVLWSNYLIGLELVFGGQSAGTVKGNFNQHTWEEVFNLGQDDCIVEIFGRAGNAINCLGFKTAKGLTKVWGNPLEGDAFSFGQNGHYIKSLKLGVETFLCFVEPVFEDINFLYARKLDFSTNGKFTQMLGKADGGSEQFDDFDWVSSKFNYAVAEVTLWHDGLYIHGIQFHYHLDGTKKTPGKHCSEGQGLRSEKLILGDDEHLTKILIRAGDWIDGITLVTDKGRKVSAGGHGGSAYLTVVPDGYQFVAVGGSVASTCRQVQFFYDEIY